MEKLKRLACRFLSWHTWQYLSDTRRRCSYCGERQDQVWGLGVLGEWVRIGDWVQ